MGETSSQSQPWTIRRLLGWIQEHLRGRGVAEPRLCAELLIAHALGRRRIDLYARIEDVPAEAQLAPLRELVKRAANHAPIAYLTEHKEFFSLDFRVSPAVLIPRPETETLVEEIIHRHRKQDLSRPLRLCDVGTGSGCIAIALAKNLPAAAVAATDISPGALAIAAENARTHKVDARLRLVRTDLLGGLAGPFDIVASNPPYIPDAEHASLPPGVREHEPKVALLAGDDGLAVIRRLIEQAPRVMAPEASLFIETAYNQAPAVAGMLDAQGIWRTIATAKDALGHERVVMARLKPMQAGVRKT